MAFLYCSIARYFLPFLQEHRSEVKVGCMPVGIDFDCIQIGTGSLINLPELEYEKPKSSLSSAALG